MFTPNFLLTKHYFILVLGTDINRLCSVSSGTRHSSLLHGAAAMEHVVTMARS
jgi:hypothetical protein